MQNSHGQDITGFPFDKAHKFASEERVVMDKLMGVKSGVVKGVMDEGKVTANGLVARVGRVLIYAKGAWIRSDMPIDIPIQPSSSGYIIARINLSEHNSSVGNIDDGSYQYLLNQVHFTTVQAAPIKEDILFGGLIYEVVLARYVATATSTTITDAREYCKNYSEEGVPKFIGNITGDMNAIILSNQTTEPAGVHGSSWSDRGSSTFFGPYKNLASLGTLNTFNDMLAIVFDNGGIDPKNNTGKSILLREHSRVRGAQNAGTSPNYGNIRAYFKDKKPGQSWPATWTTAYDTRFGADIASYAPGLCRQWIHVMKPGEAFAVGFKARIDKAIANNSWYAFITQSIDAYIVDDDYDGLSK